MKLRILLVLFGVGTLSSCIEDYTLPDDIAEEYTGQLYIEGKILSGTESLVYVMKTTDMNSRGSDYVQDARVYVESEDGGKTDLEEYSGDGTY